MKPKIYLFTLIILLINCKKNHIQEKRDLELYGNWYSFSEKEKSSKGRIDDYKYNEFFFSKSVFYSFSDISEFKNPIRYKMIKDSLFWIYSNGNLKTQNQEKEFMGLVTILKDSCFVLKNNSDSLIFYKLKNKTKTKNISDTLLEIDSLKIKTNQNYQKFVTDFRNRMYASFNK